MHSYYSYLSSYRVPSEVLSTSSHGGFALHVTYIRSCMQGRRNLKMLIVDSKYVNDNKFENILHNIVYAGKFVWLSKLETQR